MDTTTAPPTTAPAKLTREQALEKHGDVRCHLWAIREDGIEFKNGPDAAVGVILTLPIVPGGTFDIDRRAIYTMRLDDGRCRVLIIDGGHVVYEAEPRGIDYDVDDEDPDGDV